MHAERERDRLLLADSDPRDVDAVCESLEELRFETTRVGTLDEALSQIGERKPNLVLSELSLPDGSGFALCREIRGSLLTADMPIVLISRWSNENDRILAFECGADDVIAKPFFARELASRVRAVLRRSRVSSPKENRVRVGEGLDLEIRPHTHEVRIGSRRYAPTPKEFAILEALLENPGRVLTRDVLIDRVWSDEPPPGKRTVDAHVKNLRRKLGLPAGAIETIRGVGYRFTENPNRPA